MADDEDDMLEHYLATEQSDSSSHSSRRAANWSLKNNRIDEECTHFCFVLVFILCLIFILNYIDM